MSGSKRTSQVQSSSRQNEKQQLSQLSDDMSLVRALSVQQSVLSHELLSAIEEGELNDVRAVLMQDSEALRKAVLIPSLEVEHALRSPLMAAAATGDSAIYSTIYKAVERACLNEGDGRRRDIRAQLDFQDKNGMTLLMLAARSGSPFILQEVLNDINLVQADRCLLARDHALGQTVLAHAAASGSGSVFQEVLKALEDKLDEEEIADQLESRCGSAKTLLMIAAASGSQMAFSACAQAIKEYIPSSKIEGVMTARDSDGMTFLMNACTRRYRSSILLPVPIGQRTRTRLNGGDRQGLPPLSEGAGPKRAPHSGAPVSSDVEAEELVAEDASATGVPIGRAYGSAKSASDYHGGAMRFGSRRDLAGGGQRETRSQRGYTSSRRTEYLESVLYPSVPVVKAAVSLIWECLWKEQVREQLKATDSWDRSVVYHAVFSGSKQVFELVFDSIRRRVLAEEVEVLLGIAEKNDETLTALAIRSGGKELEASVSNAIQRLKSDVELRARASTLEAKIQSFIPGKLIVIFQLLLPESKTSDGHGPLYLLLVLCVFAPLLSWASGFLTFGSTSKGAETYKPRTTLVSYFLSAPAMFVWGIGTSNIGQLSFGWEDESLSATLLAVGTIVIPATDAFANSVRFKQWKDTLSFKQRRFQRQRDSEWKRARAKRIQMQNTRAEMKQRAQKRNHATHATPSYDELNVSKRDAPQTPSSAVLPVDYGERDIERGRGDLALGSKEDA